MNGFLQALKVQRWDAHRYYHQADDRLHWCSAMIVPPLHFECLKKTIH